MIAFVGFLFNRLTLNLYYESKFTKIALEELSSSSELNLNINIEEPFSSNEIMRSDLIRFNPEDCNIKINNTHSTIIDGIKLKFSELTIDRSALADHRKSRSNRPGYEFIGIFGRVELKDNVKSTITIRPRHAGPIGSLASFLDKESPKVEMTDSRYSDQFLLYCQDQEFAKKFLTIERLEQIVEISNELQPLKLNLTFKENFVYFAIRSVGYPFSPPIIKSIDDKFISNMKKHFLTYYKFADL